jgi:hypothetical protein
MILYEIKFIYVNKIIIIILMEKFSFYIILLFVCSTSFTNCVRLQNRVKIQMKSWAFSCNNASADGWIFSANCLEMDQDRVKTSIDLRNCLSYNGESVVFSHTNLNIERKCEQPSINIIRNTLTLTCDKCKHPKNFTLDLSKFVHNIDGVLKCFT